jgi:two-component system, NarL family, sensor kinase
MENASIFNISVFYLIVISAGVCVLFLFFYFLHLRRVRMLFAMRSNFYENLEQEKLKISRELHDSLGAFLVPLKGIVSQNGIVDASKQEFWQNHITQFENYISGINENIYPSEMLENNLGDALNSLSNNFNFTQCQLIVARFPDIYLKGNTGIHIYRIVQETLVNIIKHADPDFITISHQLDGHLLQINVSYQPNLKLSQDQIKKNGRGKNHISQRIDILKGEYDYIQDEEIVFEKFMFAVE